MTIITTFALAGALALSAAVPAFAQSDSKSRTLAERNTYVHMADARPIGLQTERRPSAYRAAEAMAYKPAPFIDSVDFGISSQR